MHYWIVNCSFAFVLCVLLAGWIIPQILLIAFRKKLFDKPDKRKIHHSDVPRLGGIAFKPVVFLTIAFLLGVNLLMGYSQLGQELGNNVRPFAFAFCSIMVLYLVGMADDLIGVRYMAKFLVQIACGLMLIAGGIYVGDLHGILGIHALPHWLAWPLNVLLVVFIINSINLIDGIDGLASGLSSMACLCYGIIFFMLQDYAYAMLAFATLGVLVPFFFYNVFGDAEKHRKIFMGDTGSLTIGMMLSFLSIRMSMCESDILVGEINPLVLAFTPLMIPCCDVVRVYLHRIRNKKNPFLPDDNHIHHKLIAIGMKQRQVMMVLLLAALLIVLFNCFLDQYIDVTWVVLIDVLSYTLFNIWLTKRIGQIGSKKAAGNSGQAAGAVQQGPDNKTTDN